MKIVQVLAMEGSWGGIENHTFELSKELAKNHEVHLILGLKYQGKMKHVENLHYHYLDFTRSRWNLFLLIELNNTIKFINPNIVHAQGGKASKIISFLSNFFKTPTVATIHGMKSNIKDYLSFNKVIAVSKKAAQKIEKYRTVHIVYNGIQKPSTICSSYYNHGNSCFIKALAIGRLNSVKGFDLLIEAWQGVDAELEILGDGEDFEKLSRLIEKYKLQDRVKLIGFVENVHSHIEACDFVVVSSRREGGPLVVAEALLMQKPIISTDVGMVEDFIPPIYISSIENVKKLHELIELALTNYSSLRQDFNLSFAKAEKYLVIDKMVEETVKIYKECL